MGLLDGKSGIVTGAAQGFGLATARRLAEEGAAVALVGEELGAYEGNAVGLAVMTIAGVGGGGCTHAPFLHTCFWSAVPPQGTPSRALKSCTAYGIGKQRPRARPAPPQ